jgi:hypothetical protein
MHPTTILRQRPGSDIEHPSLTFVRCTSRDPSLHPSTVDPCCEHQFGHPGKHHRRVMRGQPRSLTELGLGAVEWSDP